MKTNLVTVSTGSVSDIFSKSSGVSRDEECQTGCASSSHWMSWILFWFQAASGQRVAQALPLSQTRSATWSPGRMAAAAPPSSLPFLCLSHMWAWLQDLDVPPSSGIQRTGTLLLQRLYLILNLCDNLYSCSTLILLQAEVCASL